MTTIPTVSKSMPIIDAEMRALNALIKKRLKWLEDPINRQKRTYEAVRRDTEEMRQKLSDLKEEKDKILKS